MLQKEQSIFFDLKYMDQLKEMVKSGMFPVDTMLKSESSGNIRMDVILSEDKKFAGCAVVPVCTLYI